MTIDEAWQFYMGTVPPDDRYDSPSGDFRSGYVQGKADTEAALAECEAKLQQFAADTVEGFDCLPTCDSTAHDELCPVAHPVEAWRVLRERLAAAREALLSAKCELQCLGRDLQEISDGERQFPTALLSPEVMEMIDTWLEIE